ncbi:MAG TPA: hypothetical protein VJB16_00555 [archaeon]|nr:hypothetical protein [archaeon]
MKVCVCGSIAFYDQMALVKKELEKAGHEVDIPHSEFTDGNGNAMAIKDAYAFRQTAKREQAWVWAEKRNALEGHFRKVGWADAILVLNYEKKGVPGYVGANTLIEMGLALYLKKKIFLLNPVPEQGSTEELLGMQPIVLDGDLTKVR